jgi:hypothetical protein
MSGCSVKPHNCPHSSAHQPLTQTCIPAGRRLAIVSYSITRSIRGTQIPIVRDEPPSSRFPRFPPLEVFRRRPPVRAAPSVSGRHPKTLYGAYRCQEKTRHVLSHFVTSLHCGTAALLLGCAERSEPRSRVRRAEGAGLDRECAGRVTMSLPRRTNVLRALFDLLCGFLFCSFSFHRDMRRLAA